MPERVITTTLAEIATRHRLESDLVRLLVRAAADAQPSSPKLAESMLQRLPMSGVELGPEQRFGYKWTLPERIIARWNAHDPKPKGQRPDWVFRSRAEGIAIAVEVKLTTSCGHSQLQRYAAALKRSPELKHVPHKGLLVLCTTDTWPMPYDLRGTRRSLLGVVLWKDVMTDLRALAPADPPDRERWLEILDCISALDPPD
jgi:hypothetical protein